MSAFDRIAAALEARDCKQGRNWLCPAHDDRNASLSVSEGDDGKVLIKCFAGCSVEEIVAALGLEMRDLFEEPLGGGGSSPPRSGVHERTNGCTLADYARAKRLPEDFLRDLGISDYKDSRFDTKILRIPYRDADGAEAAVRLRRALHKGDGADDRFLWRKGSKPFLYGIWRLEQAREAGRVVIVEGESDAQTLWHHGIPAVGLPGAANWREDRDRDHFDGIERVYVLIEPDKGGEAVLGWLGESAIRDRAWLFDLDGHKDASGLHVADPATFAVRFEKAMEEAEPWRSVAARLETAERREAWERCKKLARTADILAEFIADLGRCGVTGEKQFAQIVFLVGITRLFERIASLAAKGPSAAGKSFVVEQTLRFFPDEAYFAMTGMSEHALIYDDEPLAHRIMVIYEATGMESDKLSYIIRSLLSEGRLRYPTVTKESGELKTIWIVREGPTGLVTTTTAVHLHQENETRLLSVSATDSPDQTKAILRTLADEDRGMVDFERWHALQRWLALGKAEVTIPFAKDLAELVPPKAVRLRRDFSAVLQLIRAHALLHQARRDRDDRGWVIATLDDYAAVREIVAEIVSEGVGATVKDTVREVIAAVEELDGPNIAQVARQIGIDRSAASRRIKQAIEGGYLRDDDERKTRTKLVIGDPLPEEEDILPSPERLDGSCIRARQTGGVTDPHPPGDAQPEMGRGCVSHPDSPEPSCRYCRDAARGRGRDGGQEMKR